MKWQPRDVIAMVVVLGAVSLLWKGIDTQVGWTLIAIVSGYYGIFQTPLIKIVSNHSKRKVK